MIDRRELEAMYARVGKASADLIRARLGGLRRQSGGGPAERKCPDCGANVSGAGIRCRKCGGLARRGKKIHRLAAAEKPTDP